MKVVINDDYGGFGLSNKATAMYLTLKGIEFTQTKSKYGGYEDDFETPDNKEFFSSRDIERNDPVLVKVVKELGKEANGACAKLKIVEISDDVDWYIHEHDGNEYVAEKHRTWH